MKSSKVEAQLKISSTMILVPNSSQMMMPRVVARSFQVASMSWIKMMKMAKATNNLDLCIQRVQLNVTAYHMNQMPKLLR